jgi:hypothetical protein
MTATMEGTEGTDRPLTGRGRTAASRARVIGQMKLERGLADSLHGSGRGSARTERHDRPDAVSAGPAGGDPPGAAPAHLAPAATVSQRSH